MVIKETVSLPSLTIQHDLIFTLYKKVFKYSYILQMSF